MLRIVAVVVWIGALVFLGVYLQALGRGPFASLEARHRREMKDRSEEPLHYEPITVAEFEALPQHLPVAEYSGIERRAVSLEGRVVDMIRATDGDYHIEVQPDSTEVPRPITTEITPVFHQDGDNGWSYDRLRVIFRAGNWAPPWPGGPALVRLSGWLLLDDEDHIIPKLLGVPLQARRTSWEIHPVTKIERWDDATARWVEVKR